MTTSDTSLLSLLQTIYRWRKPILKLTLAATLLAAVISFFQPNYYKAFNKFVPVNIGQVMPGVVFGGGGSAPYGTTDDLDRLQNIAGSGELASYLVTRFHLYKHYQIDSAGTRAAYDVATKFSKNYTVTKDEYGGLEVAFESTDPQLSADVANEAVAQIARIDRDLATSNLKAIAATLERTMSGSSTILDSLSREINKINRRYKYPSIALRRELLVQASPGMTPDAQLGLLQKASKISQDSLAAITENLYVAGIYDSRRSDLNGRIIGDNGAYIHIKAALESDVTTIKVIEHAVKPQIKSRPMRSLIVVGAAIATLVLSVLGILLFEQYKTINWQAIFSSSAP